MSVKITPADEKIEFLDNSGNIDAKISLDGSGNLKLENFNGGSMVLGDATADIYVGDGSASVDIVYDVGGRLYSTANQHLTIGKSSLGGNDIVIDSPNWSVTDGGIFTFKEGNIIDTSDGGAVGLKLQNSEGSIYLYTNGDDLIFKNVDDNTFPFHMLNGSASNTLVMNSTGVEIGGNIISALGDINTCVAYQYHRDDMNSGAVNLKAIRGGTSSWGYVMPKAGRVKMIVIESRNGTPGTNEQTWKINRNNNNSGTAGTDHFQFSVQRGGTQVDTGVTGDAHMVLAAIPNSIVYNSNPSFCGSVVVNLPVAKGDEIRIQRTVVNGVSMHSCSGHLYVEFD